MEFLNSLKQRSKHYNSPFDHWELNKPLAEEAIKEICKTEIMNITKMNINYDGTRAIDGGEGKFREGISDGGKAIKFRCFIGKDNSKDFPNIINLIEELKSKDTYGYIGELIKLGKSFELSFPIKHLNFIAFPPSNIPSLNLPSPPSIALVPS